jgi:RNA polymerase sigma factor (sigma-70 family)
MTVSEELDLVGRAVRGETGAFEELTTRSRAIVESCLRRTLHSRDAADWADLRQSFYVYLLADDRRVLRSYEGKAPFTTWIHTVASRHFRREAARRRRDTDQRDVLDADGEHVDPTESPEQRELRRESIARVRAAVAELCPEDQVLLEMLIDEDAPAPVVARALGITADGVRMRKMRLLRRLGTLIPAE